MGGAVDARHRLHKFSGLGRMEAKRRSRENDVNDAIVMFSGDCEKIQLQL
jgi:hypothetical protein